MKKVDGGPGERHVEQRRFQPPNEKKRTQYVVHSVEGKGLQM